MIQFKEKSQKQARHHVHPHAHGCMAVLPAAPSELAAAIKLTSSSRFGRGLRKWAPAC